MLDRGYSPRPRFFAGQSPTDFVLWPALVAFIVSAGCCGPGPANAVGWLLLLTSVGSQPPRLVGPVRRGYCATTSASEMACGPRERVVRVHRRRSRNAAAASLSGRPAAIAAALVANRAHRGRLFMFFAAFNIFDTGKFNLAGTMSKVAEPVRAAPEKTLDGVLIACACPCCSSVHRLVSAVDRLAGAGPTPRNARR